MTVTRKLALVAAVALAALGVGRASAGTGVEPLAFHAPAPYRAFDSRTMGTKTKIVPGFSATVCGPANAMALAVKVGATQPDAAGYLVAYPANQVAGPTSIVDFVAGQTVANSGLISTDTQGCIRVASPLAATHIIVDIQGYFTA